MIWKWKSSLCFIICVLRSHSSFFPGVICLFASSSSSLKAWGAGQGADDFMFEKLERVPHIALSWGEWVTAWSCWGQLSCWRAVSHVPKGINYPQYEKETGFCSFVWLVGLYWTWHPSVTLDGPFSVKDSKSSLIRTSSAWTQAIFWKSKSSVR